MSAPERLVFFERHQPSANMILIRGNQPTLIDTGFGGDLATTERVLHAAGVPPTALDLIINTHCHCDHSGGNHGLQTRYTIPIATFHQEAELINRRDPNACVADWMDHPVEPYRVDRLLVDGEIIDVGDVAIEVIHTPGHTRGHIALYLPDDQALICGDAVHDNDVAWINRFYEGEDSLDHALESLDRLAALPVRWACSGHGPAFADVYAAIDAARRRYERWRHAPHRLAWHACKRLFAYALMLYDGLDEAEIAPYLLKRRWFRDYGGFYFQLAPEDFVQPLIDEMLRSDAAIWHNRRLMALTPYNPPSPTWLASVPQPEIWE